jgi:microcin C transport system permease protein
MISKLIKNPIAHKRLARLKEMRRPYLSLWILIVLYLISLSAELICNDKPLFMRYEGKAYFPVFKFYPDDVFTGSGKQTRPDYHQIDTSPKFNENPQNYMVFPPFSWGPFASIDPQSIEVADHVTLRFVRLPLIGTVNVRPDYAIVRSRAFSGFVSKSEEALKGIVLTELFSLPADVLQAVELRFENRPAQAISRKTTGINGEPLDVMLSTYRPRAAAPRSVRLTFQEPLSDSAVEPIEIDFDRRINFVTAPKAKPAADLWAAVSDSEKKRLLSLVGNRFDGALDSLRIKIDGITYKVDFIKEEVIFPYGPTKGHFLGIDNAGRDVFARILYGLRTSMTFGLLLVICSMALGIAAGAVQGYFGGLIDISGQRLIEIWSALPFLYIMILMGSVFGRSFSLLLIVYGVFNWIGISYYMRAEFLRLRRQPFVESAKCMGIPTHKIIFRHILPNALVPVITFFPFSLVGAIGALAALDYLGFGLPPPTPSWGELLSQAQQYRWAWWLILYPSLALFIVMLLGVFIGEGIRNAYDPKRYTRLE